MKFKIFKSGINKGLCRTGSTFTPTTTCDDCISAHIICIAAEGNVQYFVYYHSSVVSLYLFKLIKKKKC